MAQSISNLTQKNPSLTVFGTGKNTSSPKFPTSTPLNKNKSLMGVFSIGANGQVQSNTNPVTPSAGLVPTPASPTSSNPVKGLLQPNNEALLGNLKSQLASAQSLLASKQNETKATKSITPKTTTPAQPTAPTYAGITSALVDRTSKPSEAFTKAQDAQLAAAENLRKFRGNVADYRADIYSDPVSARVMQGRDAAIQAANASKEAALGSELEAATGMLATTLGLEGQQLGALQGAAGLAQPSQAAYGQTVFNPLTGQYSDGGGLPPEVMQQYAQMAASGQYNTIPSFITSNPVLNAQLNVAAKSINPNFTPVAASGASTVLQTLPSLKSAETAAEGIKNTIVSYLSANPQLNPSDLAAGNILKQWIEGKQLTDPKYQTLFNYLNEYTNTLAPILGVGGNPTNLKTEIAQNFINAAASGQSISQVLNNISQLAANKLVDMERGALGQGTAVPTPGSTGSFAETW